jgi:hypothetical protein
MFAGRLWICLQLKCSQREASSVCSKHACLGDVNEILYLKYIVVSWLRKHVVPLLVTNVSEEPTVSIFSV